jgi:hypothetical protein
LEMWTIYLGWPQTVILMISKKLVLQVWATSAWQVE